MLFCMYAHFMIGDPKCDGSIAVALSVFEASARSILSLTLALPSPVCCSHVVQKPGKSCRLHLVENIGVKNSYEEGFPVKIF